MNLQKQIEEQEASGTQVNDYLIKCRAGCLDHIIGISYFEHGDNWTDEPEMYFETRHLPYHTFWERVKAAWSHIWRSTALDWDCTLISYTDACRMIELLSKYKQEYEAWYDKNINKS